MTMYDIIEKKKHGIELSTEEIQYFVSGYTEGSIPDYQASALLMAIYFKGMNERERFDLTMSMRDSGDILDLSAINGVKVDKHSTGGVGDKVTLVLGPIIASCGVPVAKMSGRGLGHTGGTIDKLEAFDGFHVTLTEDQFVNQVNSIGIAVVGQSANLAPADKKLYALRDLTATVDEISLITSSIMSKKLAAGTDAIVLDVTVGNGAFMKNKEDATKLAESMVKIGKNANKKIAAVMTCMEEPLGFAVGNTLEVLEAIEALKGNGPKDLMEVVFSLGERMIVFAEQASSTAEAREMMKEAISSGKALEKLTEFIGAQGGDTSFVKDVTKFKKAAIIKPVTAKKSGYVKEILAMEIGIASMRLGGGREELDDIIDMSVGVILNKKIGSYVEVGEPLAFIHANHEDKCELAYQIVENAIFVSDEKVEEPELILGIVD